MDYSNKEKKFHSLLVTLVLSFLALCGFILLFIITFEIYFQYRTQEKAISAQQQVIAKDAANIVVNFIQSKITLLIDASNFSNFTSISPDSQKNTLEKLLGKETAFRQLVLFNNQVHKTMKISRLSSFEQSQLENIVSKNYEQSTRKQYVYISPVYIDKDNNEPLVVIVIPILDSLGNYQGAIAAELELKFMWDLVANIKVGEKGEAYVIDNKGNLIAYGDTSKILVGENLSKLDVANKFIKKVSLKDNAEIATGIRNTQVVTSYISLYKPDWAVIVELPLSEAYAPIITAINTSAVIAIVSLILVIILSIYLSRRITKPVVTLRDAATLISQGYLDTKVTVSTNNEIGELAQVLNLMTDKLQKSYIGLTDNINQLSSERARLQASINSLSIGYIMTGLQNEILLINDTAKNIFTLSTETAEPIQKVIDVSNIKEYIDMSFIVNSIKDKTNLIEQMELAKKEKKSIIIKDVPFKMLILKIYIAPIIKQDNQEVIGTVLLIDDITERKILERSKDEFFSIASHELRTPLTAIRGNTSMINKYYLKDIKNPEVIDMIGDIHESSLRLINIVNDFLDMSRLELGKIQYQSEAFEIVQLCQDVLKEYDVTGSRKRLILKVIKPEKEIPLVYADKTRIRQIIVNLIGNGIKFTDQGGVTIGFSVLKNQVKVEVTDTGKGIPENNKILLFRKFQQAQSNILTRETTSGTGLGLYISKIMIEHMGGTIELERTEIGKGSTFSFTLPIATTVDKLTYEKGVINEKNV